MRTFLIGILISFALTAMSQDADSKAAVSDSSASNFASLEPFVRGLAMSNREVTIYRVRTNSLPSYKHSRPIVIVWTREGTVTEQKDGEASTTRKISVGQIDVYQSGTTHSLRAVKGAMHFTLIELKQSLIRKKCPASPQTAREQWIFLRVGLPARYSLQTMRKSQFQSLTSICSLSHSIKEGCATRFLDTSGKLRPEKVAPAT